MVIFVGPSSFIESLYTTFAGLAADPVAKVRKTLASSLHELAKLVGSSFNTTKVQIVRLFHSKNILWINTCKNNSEALRCTVFGAWAAKVDLGRQDRHSGDQITSMHPCRRLKNPGHCLVGCPSRGSPDTHWIQVRLGQDVLFKTFARLARNQLIKHEEKFVLVEDFMFHSTC